MAYWLFKEEPTHYSFADLEKDGETVWEGIRNPLARQNLRKVARGDAIFFYHTGKERAVVGEMEAVSDPEPGAGDPKSVVVRVRATRRLPKPVTLERLKQEKSLANWELIRMSRLSVVPVTAQQWAAVQRLSREA